MNESGVATTVAQYGTVATLIGFTFLVLLGYVLPTPANLARLAKRMLPKGIERTSVIGALIMTFAGTTFLDPAIKTMVGERWRGPARLAAILLWGALCLNAVKILWAQRALTRAASARLPQERQQRAIVAYRAWTINIDDSSAILPL